jgi:hypothetical protein
MKKSIIIIISTIVSICVIVALVLTMMQSEQAGTTLSFQKLLFQHNEPIKFSFTVFPAKDSCTIPSYEIFYEDYPEPVFSRSYMTPLCSEYPFFFKPSKTWDFPLEGDIISFDKNGVYTIIVKYNGDSASMQFTVSNFPNFLEETSSNE